MSLGAVDERGEVDRWAHFVNTFMLDRDGRRVNRRNAQDIFVPLYNHQIPPGAAQVVHYALDLPPDLAAPVVVDVQLQYRKFDQEYMQWVVSQSQPGDQPLRGVEPGRPYVNTLPITTLAADRVVFPVAGSERVIAAVYADNGISPRPLRDVELLEVAAEQVGIAFENELLRRQLAR